MKKGRIFNKKSIRVTFILSVVLVTILLTCTGILTNKSKVTTSTDKVTLPTKDTYMKTAVKYTDKTGWSCTDFVSNLLSKVYGSANAYTNSNYFTRICTIQHNKYSTSIYDEFRQAGVELQQGDLLIGRGHQMMYFYTGTVGEAVEEAKKYSDSFANDGNHVHYGTSNVYGQDWALEGNASYNAPPWINNYNWCGNANGSDKSDWDNMTNVTLYRPKLISKKDAKLYVYKFGMNGNRVGDAEFEYNIDSSSTNKIGTENKGTITATKSKVGAINIKDITQTNSKYIHIREKNINYGNYKVSDGSTKTIEVKLNESGNVQFRLVNCGTNWGSHFKWATNGKDWTDKEPNKWQQLDHLDIGFYNQVDANVYVYKFDMQGNRIGNATFEYNIDNSNINEIGTENRGTVTATPDNARSN